VLRDGVLVQEVMLRQDQRSAQSLTIALRELMQGAGVTAQEVKLVAVAHGPGSFTGLRVGLMAAKVLAYAWKCEVVGVDTLEVIAQQANAAEGGRVWGVVDAQRQQLFAATFRVQGGEYHPELPSTVLSRQQLLDSLEPGDVVAGAGLKPLLDKLPTGVTVADQDNWQPRAATVGPMADKILKTSKSLRTWQELQPHYLRGSAAEENPKFQRPA
jgi:tRNA threonylcarbamoyladenosine biosynthesis protein TsaB